MKMKRRSGPAPENPRIDRSAEESRMHHYLGIELNIQTWKLIEKENRDEQDDERMAQFAHGSLYHWQRSPRHEPVNTQRGEWLLSRVYALRRDGEAALKHAAECLKVTMEHKIGGVDLAFAHEAMARALAVLGRKAESRAAIARAKAAAQAVAGPADRRYVLRELKSGF
jgi:hypothetical protein